MSFFPVNQAKLVAYRNPVECKERARAVGPILEATLSIRYFDFRDLAFIKLFSPQGRRNTMLVAWKLSIGNRPPQLVEEGVLLR